MLMWNKNIFIPNVQICQTTWQQHLPLEHLETVHVSELVAVYAEGKLGFWIYEQFSDIVAAAVDMKRQHTPNLEKRYTYTVVKRILQVPFFG